MDCEREHECLLYLWGEIQQSQRVAFVRHLAQCPACKGQVEALGPLVRAMRDTQLIQLPEEVARSVSTRLAEDAETRPRTVRFQPQRLLAAAASIVLLVGVAILWLNTLNKSPEPAGTGVQRVEISDDEYIDALALVLISEPADADDILTQAIEDVAYQIAELSQEIDQDSGPIEPSKSGPDEQGSNPAAAKVRMT